MLLDKKKSALAARIARLQVFAAADFAHHVGSNTLRLDLSCSRGTGTRGMTLSHCIGCQRGRTKCAAHLSQMRLDNVDEPVQLGPMTSMYSEEWEPYPARQRPPMLETTPVSLRDPVPFCPNVWDEPTAVGRGSSLTTKAARGPTARAAAPTRLPPLDSASRQRTDSLPS